MVANKKIDMNDLPEGSYHHKVPVMRPPGSIQLWGLNALCYLIRDLYQGQVDRVLEVGSFAGESMQVFSRILKPKEILCVDPYMEDGSIKRELGDYAPSMKVVKGLFKDRATEIEREGLTQVTLIERYFQSWNEVNVIGSNPDSEYSFIPEVIYIDADHSYKAVKNDLEIADGYRREFGSLICGHDYADGWPEVKRAVQEFANDRGLPIITFEDGSYMLLEFE